MRYHLALEQVGYRLGTRNAGLAGMLLRERRRAMGACVRQAGRYVRPHQVEVSAGNGALTRGVLFHYYLEPGSYLVSAPLGWKQTTQYTLTVTPDGQATRCPNDYSA